MNTYDIKKRHNKATEILELIEYADIRIKTNRECINGFPGTFPRLAAKYRHQIEITKMAKERLIKYYYKTLKN
jgi:hypothetical protein